MAVMLTSKIEELSQNFLVAADSSCHLVSQQCGLISVVQFESAAALLIFPKIRGTSDCICFVFLMC